MFKREDRWSGAGALPVPRQRRHQLPLERHGAARLPARRCRGRQVIRTIVDVARRFPVIRFDAAMVLAKRHIQRLWYPLPGSGGGAIASRAESSMTQEAVRRRDARRVLARGRGPDRRGGTRHAPARGGVLAARGLLRAHPGHAPRLQQRLHAHAPRRGQRGLPEGHPRDGRLRRRASWAATSTS